MVPLSDVTSSRIIVFGIGYVLSSFITSWYIFGFANLGNDLPHFLFIKSVMKGALLPQAFLRLWISTMSSTTSVTGSYSNLTRATTTSEATFVPHVRDL